jgi:hypothetical protein
MKLRATTEAENYRARIDTLEQRNSDLEKQVTALHLQIENGSPDIATPLKPKRKCVDLSLPGVPVSFAWDEPEMKQRLITASAYLRDYPLGIKSYNGRVNHNQSVMSIPEF